MNKTEYKEKIKELDNQIDFLSKEKCTLEDGYEKFIIDNKLYEKDLSKYKNQSINSISVIIKCDDKFTVEHFFDGKVDKHSHLNVYKCWDMSHWGYRWSAEKKGYIVYSSHINNDEVVDVIGFFDIEVE